MLPLLMASLLIAANAALIDHLPSHLFEAHPGPMIYKHATEQTINQTSDSHTFHTLQTKPTFRMTRMTEVAPWSARIQPAILPMYREITYKNWYSGTTNSQASDWLILFEGSLGSRSGVVNQLPENDVWASGDGGVTWDLIAGTSRYGTRNVTSAWGYQKETSFSPRTGATNCEDPSSDVVFSIGGTTSSVGGPAVGSNQVWESNDGISWGRYYDTGLPNRYYASCDVDVSGHVFTMGGITIDPQTYAQKLLNDVWTNFRSEWQPTTLRAPWAARAEHAVLITENPKLGRDIIYVLGGMTNTQGTQNTNDVWASSDAGASWVKMPTPGWLPRWGHAGITNADGVLVILGGSDTIDGSVNGMYSYRDVWASFDGAMTWKSCRLPAGDDTKRDFIRTEQGATLLTNGHLMIASGYSFCPAGECEHMRYDYRDVWMSDFSLDNTALLASMCDAKVPSYIGLSVWPSTTPVNPRSIFVMTPLAHNAPWSQRTEPALLRMSKPVKYTQAKSGLTISTPPNWLLMYEGSRNYINWVGSTSLENDVWASGDNGRTWDVISGISYESWTGVVNSSHPDTSFQGREYAANCEDPTNDDVYSIGGAHYDSEWNYVGSTYVQYSEDAQNWVMRTGSSFGPARWLASCDVSNNGVLILIGGLTRRTSGNTRPSLLNDVWLATGQGKYWTYAGEAPFSPRSETQVVIYGSDVFDTDIVYVVGGYTKYDQWNDKYQSSNDIWASRDSGYTWVEINEAPTFSPRWGHALLVTEKGVLMVAGGANSKTGKERDNISLRDVYISLDGGYYWSQCNLPTNVDYIRTNQGAQLTEDGRVLLISGYSLWTGWQRRDYKDVYESTASLDDLDAIAAMCKNVQMPPGRKTGLLQWPGETPPEPESEEAKKLTTKGLIVVILVSIAVGLCIVFALWSKRSALFPSMFGGVAETQMTDFSPLFDNPRLPSESEGDDSLNTSS